MRACRYGSECRDFQHGRCRFSHAPQPVQMPELSELVTLTVPSIFKMVAPVGVRLVPSFQRGSNLSAQRAEEKRIVVVDQQVKVGRHLFFRLLGGGWVFPVSAEGQVCMQKLKDCEEISPSPFVARLLVDRTLRSQSFPDMDIVGGLSKLPRGTLVTLGYSFELDGSRYHYAAGRKGWICFNSADLVTLDQHVVVHKLRVFRVDNDPAGLALRSDLDLRLQSDRTLGHNTLVSSVASSVYTEEGHEMVFAEDARGWLPIRRVMDGVFSNTLKEIPLEIDQSTWKVLSQVNVRTYPDLTSPVVRVEELGKLVRGTHVLNSGSGKWIHVDSGAWMLCQEPGPKGVVLLQRVADIAGQPSALKKPKGEDLCCVCLDRMVDVGLLHGDSVHSVVCGGCARTLRDCPVCRRPIDKIVKVF